MFFHATCMLYARLGLYAINVLPSSLNNVVFLIVACQIDLVFALSTSLKDNTQIWSNMVNFTASLVNRMRIGPNYVKVGFVTYGTSGINHFYLNSTTTRVALLQRLLTLSPFSTLANSINLAEALAQINNVQFLSVSGDRLDMRNVVVLLSAEPSDLSRELIVPQANLLKNSGVHIFAIGVDNANASEIQAISSSPQLLNSNYFMTQDSLLPTYVNTLFNLLCPAACNGQLSIILCIYDHFAYHLLTYGKPKLLFK